MDSRLRDVILGMTLIGAALGCGGGGGGTKATGENTMVSKGGESGKDAGGKAMTQAQLKLGHFVSADGMHGFVLDRTGPKAKLQIDGEKDIIELTMEEDRERGELRGYKFVGPDNKRRIYITRGGGLLYFKGGDEHWVSFDKEVEPLGKPTIAGAPVKEVPAYEKVVAELKPITVRVKFPKFTALDSSNLAKVAEAYGMAEAAMFVHYIKPDKDGWVARMDATHDSARGTSYGAGDYATDEDEDKRHAKLAKHGGVIRGYSSPERAQGNHIIIRQAEGISDELLDKMPGLLWEIDGTRAVFVSLDGGRYSVDLSQKSNPIGRGAGPESGWPKPATYTFADITMVSELADAKAVPSKTYEELEKIDVEWNNCVVKGWKGAQAKIDTGKLSVGQVKAEIKKLHTACNKHIDRFEATILKFIEERTKERTALFATASARAKSTGAAK
jgi:hypothetical protein